VVVEHGIHLPGCLALKRRKPSPFSTLSANSYSDGTLNDGNSYWYLITAANSCPEVP
jgi:hypothetical protein